MDSSLKTIDAMHLDGDLQDHSKIKQAMKDHLGAWMKAKTNDARLHHLNQHQALGDHISGKKPYTPQRQELQKDDPGGMKSAFGTPPPTPPSTPSPSDNRGFAERVTDGARSMLGKSDLEIKSAFRKSKQLLEKAASLKQESEYIKGAHPALLEGLKNKGK